MSTMHFSHHIARVFGLALLLGLVGCHKDQPRPDVKTCHQLQITRLASEVVALTPLFADYGVDKPLFSGTLLTQSGETPVFLAPLLQTNPFSGVDLADGKELAFGALYVSDAVPLIQTGNILPAGVYLMVFSFAADHFRLQLIDPNRQVAATLTTRELVHNAEQLISDDIDDLVKKAEERIKKLGLNLLLVDISIEFGGGRDQPSIVKASVLFWDFDLFEDPPLPYLAP